MPPTSRLRSLRSFPGIARSMMKRTICGGANPRRLPRTTQTTMPMPHVQYGLR